MRQRWPVVLVFVFIALGFGGCRALFVPLPPPPPPTETAPTPSEDRFPDDFVPRGIPGLYLAWGSPQNAIPPTRQPGDPAGVGNQLMGLDCISYLGSGGDVGAQAVWDNRAAINWSAYDDCIAQAAQRTVRLPTGEVIPQPVILTLPSTFSDTGSRWYRTSGHGAPGSADNPYMRLHLPPWMQNDAYRFTFTAPSGNVYQSIRYGGEFKQRMIEFIQAAGLRYAGNSQIAAIRVAVGGSGREPTHRALSVLLGRQPTRRRRRLAVRRRQNDHTRRAP